MGMYEGRGQLAKAIKQLQLRWNETKGSWNDVNSRHFEQKWMLPLENDLRSALGAMDNAMTLLNQIRRDCK